MSIPEKYKISDNKKVITIDTKIIGSKYLLTVEDNGVGMDKDTLNKYIEFLKCGGDKDIDETFKILGVNLEDQKVYEEGISFFESLLDKYEKIYNE